MTKLTPLQAIRIHCKECAGTPNDIKNCKGDKLLDGTVCVFYKYRFGAGGGVGKPSVKTIKAFCKDCMGGDSALVNMCFSNTKCILYPFRFGKNPNFVLSRERLEFLRENMKKIVKKGR